MVDADSKRVIAHNSIATEEVRKRAEDASRLFAHMDSHRICFPVCFILSFVSANVCYFGILFTRVGGRPFRYGLKGRNIPSLPR